MAESLSGPGAVASVCETTFTSVRSQPCSQGRFSRSKKLKRRRTAAKPLTWRSGLVPRRPRTFERLEDRLMLTTLVVNNPTDTAVAAELLPAAGRGPGQPRCGRRHGDTITFDSSLGSKTITLTQGQLVLSGAGAGTITIDGSSPSTPLTISGGGDGPYLPDR